jgi:hypothetical protein
MTEAELILARLEAKSRSFRGAFIFGLAGLATIVAANIRWGVPDVIRTKTMNVVGDNGIVATIGVSDHKVVVGTQKGSANLVAAGEGSTGAGVIAVSATSGKSVLRLSTVKNAGGSLGVNGPDGVEIANASPNITNAGSLFIDNVNGALIGEINGDKVNGGAIIVHNAQGTETGRVHQ